VAYIVLPGKYSTDLVLDIRLPGKQNPLLNPSQVAYRPARELISSCGGRYIVLPGKLTWNNADLSRKVYGT
jgi:hypothetical protein